MAEEANEQAEHEGEAPGTETAPETELAEVHARALSRFDEAVEYQRDVRDHALLCRRFIAIPGAMWEGPWGEQFENTIRVEVDKVSRAVENIIRDYRSNRIVPDFKPAGGEGDQETADTLDGAWRADAQRSNASQAFDNALDEAAAGGMGAWRECLEYEDPLNPDDDRLRINPGEIIVDADQRVYFDPNAKTYDKRDARYCYVLTAYTPDAFKEEFGAKDEDGDADGGCMTTWADPKTRPAYDWFTPEQVIVAEYYEVSEAKEVRLTFTNRLTNETEAWWQRDIDPSEIKQREADGWTVSRAKRIRRIIRKYVLSGAEVLEGPQRIPGKFIPIVPVYGKRFYVDGVERFRGAVSKLMDAQRIYNARVSRMGELAALAPREKPIFAPEQMPPHLAETWARQDVDRLPFVLAEPLRDGEGNPVTLGPIGKVEAPTMSQVEGLLLQIAANDLAEETQDGAAQVVSNTSAEAMEMAATRVDERSALYLDNMAQSMTLAGEIYLGMAAEAYVEEGRKIETMSEDGDDGLATIAEPYTDGAGVYRLKNDFGSGRYKVVVSVTEATRTRKDKTVKSALSLAELAMTAGDQDLSQAALITAVSNMDGEGLDDLRSYTRKKGLAMGLVKPNEEEQAQMDEEAQNAQPDPTQSALEAQANALNAQAKKDEAAAAEVASRIPLNRAKTVQALAGAGKSRADAMRPNPVTGIPRVRIGQPGEQRA